MITTVNNTQIPQSYAIGIDVGGTSLKCGVVNEFGEVLFSYLVSLKEAKTEQEIILLIANVIQQCTERLNESILGIGIGFPGVIEENVIIGGADNLPGFVQFPLGEVLSELTDLPIIIDNDANLMGLGELTYGAAKYSSDVVFLTVGTGIGGAILIDHRPYGGFKNHGSELGHIVIEHGGLECSCGGQGCLEAYASITALLKFYKNESGNSSNEIDGKYLIEKYHAGEREAVKALNHHFDYLASGIISFINIFSPQKVVIGGGISESGPFYISELIKRVEKRVIPITAKHTEIVTANLGNKAGILGCAARVFQNFKPAEYETK